ncbi:MAG: hypothetical protein Q4G68_13925 [Planctomycetia bacterium]|nr:hypothetical protein [Planctomycetia bacterium]
MTILNSSCDSYFRSHPGSALRTCLFFCLLLIVCPLFGADHSQNAQVCQEAQEGWEQLRDAYAKGFYATDSCVQGKPGQASNDVLDVSSSIVHEYTILGTMEMRKTIREHIQHIQCINHNYGFILKRNKESDPWLIESITHLPDEMREESIQILSGNIPVYEGVMIEGAWLSDLVKSKDFVITNLEYSDPASPETSDSVAISFTSKFRVDAFNQILSGTLWLNPKRLWTLNRYEIQVKSDTLGTAQKTIEYTIFNDIPYPHEVVLDYNFDGDLPVRYKTSYAAIMSQTPVAEDFHLTHYGFPEPALPWSPGTTLRWIMILTGFVLVCVGIGLKLRATQRPNGEKIQ